jgi:hypothetical protein
MTVRRPQSLASVPSGNGQKAFATRITGVTGLANWVHDRDNSADTQHINNLYQGADDTFVQWQRVPTCGLITSMR